MENVIKALQTLSVHRIGVEVATFDYHHFSNIQVNYGMKKAVFSVKISFDGCSFKGSGPTVWKAVQNIIEDTNKNSKWYRIIDKNGAQHHAFS